MQRNLKILVVVTAGIQISENIAENDVDTVVTGDLQRVGKPIISQ